MAKKPKRIQCDMPGCASQEAKRLFIPTNQFRGDDVVVNACKQHRQNDQWPALLATEKAKGQLA